MNSPCRRALGITYSPKEGWEVTAATLADGDDAGGGSSHPDVAEQKDHFRHWRHAVTSVGEGRCIQLFRAGEGKNLCLRQKHHMERDHDFPIGRALWLQPHAVLGTEQGWFNPHTASAARSGCSPELAQLLLPACPQLSGAACRSRWLPHA